MTRPATRRQALRCGLAVRLRAALSSSPLALKLAIALALGCGHVPSRSGTPALPAITVHVVSQGWHSGIIVPAVLAQDWPARHEFAQAEFFEVGWGDRAYYQATDPGWWLGLRALLWPTPAVLHVVAFDGPVERYFAQTGLIELALTAPGFSALVAVVRDSHERAEQAAQPAAEATAGTHDWPPPLGPGLYGASRFYASRERFHLFRTCNVWTAGVLAAAGMPLRPATAITADSLFAQLRPHGRVLREPPR